MKKYFLILFVAILFSFSLTFTSFGAFGASNSNADSKCDVSFHFDGLQVIAFGSSKRVSDGILDVHHHEPNIEIKQIKQGKESIVRVIKASELKDKTLNISIPSKQLNPTKYLSPDMSKDTQDFRWCLDLENDLFQKQLYLREDKLFTKIHFQVGEFFTSQLTDEKYKFVAGSKLHSFNRKIGRPGASVKLGDGEQLLISGLDKTISLPYVGGGASYKVNITNLPPKDMMSIDHFGFYYDFVKEPVTRFMPIEIGKASYSPRPYLCEAIILSKSFIK
ncbi:MAG: hypothetical protein WAQ98_11235 [Blastocatellia bacterium]